MVYSTCEYFDCEQKFTHHKNLEACLNKENDLKSKTMVICTSKKFQKIIYRSQKIFDESNVQLDEGPDNGIKSYRGPKLK